MRRFAEVYPGIRCDVVESDARVVALARRWFGLGDIPGVHVEVQEGAAFLERAPTSCWDIVVVDAYGDAELPTKIGRAPFFADVARVLRPGGACAFNVIGALAGPVVSDVTAAAAAALDDVRLVPVVDPGEAFSATARRNVVVIGRARVGS